MRMLCSLAVALAFVAMAASAGAQAPTAVAVDFDRAQLSWTPGAGGDPATFTDVDCGTASGVYTISHPVAVPATSVFVKDVISAGGSYFCAVRARNDFGVSAYSNEVAFRAGRAPGAPSGFTLTAK